MTLACCSGINFNRTSAAGLRPVRPVQTGDEIVAQRNRKPGIDDDDDDDADRDQAFG